MRRSRLISYSQVIKNQTKSDLFNDSRIAAAGNKLGAGFSRSAHSKLSSLIKKMKQAPAGETHNDLDTARQTDIQAQLGDSINHFQFKEAVRKFTLIVCLWSPGSIYAPLSLSRLRRSSSSVFYSD